jgi:molybdopterin-guanine dinucleotide biosynthesis protein MobB
LTNILCIVGQKGVGKTTLIERLVPELKRRGYRVATVKRPPHHFELDTPGKDSYRHFAAGADATLVYADDRLALIRRLSEAEALEGLVAEFLNDFDLVLAEGHKTAPLPKIEIFRTGVHPEPLYDGQPEYLAVASDVPLELSIPCLDLADSAGIAAFIASRFPLGSLHGRPRSL